MEPTTHPTEMKEQSTRFRTICQTQSVGNSQQLTELNQSLNLSYGFILLKETNSSIEKCQLSLKIAVWDPKAIQNKHNIVTLMVNI